MWITARFLWITLWTGQEPEMAGRGLLRGARGGSRNVSPFGNGHHLGGDSGNVGGAGRPVPFAGTWPRRAARCVGKAGQLARQRGEAGQGPSISYMEGPCLILAARNVFAGTAAARRQPPECATAIARGQVFDRRRNPVADGPVRHVPARGCGDAGWTVTGRGARADRGARPYRVQDEHDGQAGDGYTGPPVL
jgi:hypothetical protein